MPSLNDMQARIADELGQRTDINSEIANAITTAIQAYQHESLWFAKRRDFLAFPTVASTPNYNASTNANIPLIQKFDFVKIIVTTTTIFTCTQIDQGEMESLQGLTLATNIPFNFSFYNDELWLYPNPAAQYTCRVGATFAMPAPASGTDTTNVWMNQAERLVRARAKWELAVHVLEDDDLATRMKAAVEEAQQQLVQQTSRKMRLAKGRVKAMEF